VIAPCLAHQCGAPLRGPRWRARPTWRTQRVGQRSPPSRSGARRCGTFGLRPNVGYR